MKQLLVVVTLLLTASLTFGQVNPQKIRVKIKPEYAVQLEQNKNRLARGGYSRVGISGLDRVNEQETVVSYKRVFSDGGKFSKRREKFGLHLWYEITFNEGGVEKLSNRLNSFEVLSEVDVAEAIYEKKFIDGSATEPTIVKKASSAPDPLFTPNDPQFDDQWHYHNTGQTGGAADADIDLVEAWNTTTGSTDVIVAIIDGGIDTDHEDLSGNMWINDLEAAGTPGIDDDGNGFVDDIHGYNFAQNQGTITAHNHGTHVAGTVAAVSNNGVGIAGVAGGSGANDGARLMSVQVFSNAGAGGFAESFAYAADNGAIISQNSWGYTSAGFFEQAVLDGIDYFIANAGYDINGDPFGPMQGGIVIFAAGNDNSSADHYPGYYAPTLAVASTNHLDQKAWYSNYGDWVDIAAPGGETSVTNQGVLSTLPNDTYGFYQGTSMACPHVSGVAALIVAEYGGIGYTPTLLRARLQETTDDIDASNPSYIGLLGTGRLNAAFALLEDDGIAPDPVSDLDFASLRFNEVDLTWTSPPDDDNTSSAGYEIRYSLSPIDNANFNGATLGVLGSSNIAGTSETFTLDGLDAETTYFIAIKTSDFFGNQSDISNVISISTPAPPVIEVSPLSLTSNLFTGGSEAQTITISNTGQSDLTYSISRQNVIGSSNIVSHELVQLEKGAADTRVGDPILFGSGSDDSEFGYNWIDSNEPGGPTFDWQDISATGTAVSLSDDSFSTIPLSFDFLFYGVSYTDVTISSNGYLSFSTAGASSFSNTTLPNSNIPNSLIAPMWDDLNPGVGGSVHYLQQADHFIVQYTGVPYYSSGGSNTFQVILYQNGQIKFQYLSISGAANSATVGIENETGTIGLQVAFNTTYIENDLAVVIESSSYPEVGVSPAQGVIAAGSSEDIEVLIDATGLDGGTYESIIGITNNDPANSLVSVPLTVNVTGVTDINVSASEIDFNQLFIGETVADSIRISNEGTDLLEISSITNSNSDFSVDLPVTSLSPGDFTYLKVYYQPTAVAIDADVIQISSNDPDEGIIDITLNGQGIEPPIIGVDPTSLSSSLFTGESETQVLSIENTGASDLVVNVSPVVLSTTPTRSPKATTIATQVEYSDEAFSSSESLTPTLKNNFYETFSDSLVIYYEDMEAGASGWDHYAVSGSVDNWDLTTDRSNSGSYSYQVSQHGSQGSDALQSPTINLVGSDVFYLAFSHWHQFDDCADPTFEVDGGFVELSTDGTVWQRITPIDGYPYVLDEYCSNPIEGEEAYSHANGQFTVETFDLSTFAGQSIQLRFLSGWDCGNCGFNEGWYIDDVIVYTPVTWLSTNISEVVIAPGMSEQIEVEFNAAGLNGGLYEGEILLSSNDPINSELAVPVTLDVTGAPDIDIQVSGLDLGEVFIGASKTDSVLVENLGTDDLIISSVSNSLGAYVVSIDETNLVAGASTYLRISFAPGAAIAYDDVIEISSNDVDESLLMINLSGEGLEPPVAHVDPTSLTSDLFTGESETQFISISNTGGADLTYNISADITAPAFENLSTTDLNSIDRTKKQNTDSEGISPSYTLYTGDHLRFGISDFGEIMPFQYAIGNEHLENGAYVSGYTVAYRIGGTDNVAFSAYQTRLGMSTVSYDEVVNDANLLVVQVVTETSDMALQIHRQITFEKNSKSVKIETEIQNLSGSLVEDVVFKSFADWDVDGSPGDDNWNIIPEKNMIYAFNTTYVSIATTNLPDLIDMNGWDDYQRRETNQDVLGELFAYDGFEILHYNLGDLVNGATNEVTTAFIAGDSVDDLVEEFDAIFPSWLTLDRTSGVIPAGQTEDISVTFDAAGLNGGTYETDLLITTNDPINSEVTVPAALNVTGAPDIELESLALIFEEVYLGATASDSILMTNSGTDDLIISGLSNNLIEYTVSVDNLTLSPGESTYLRVSFTPLSVNSFLDVVEIISNDTDESTVSIDLTGLGVEPPVIDVSPSTIISDLLTGETEDQILSLNNVGGSDLNFSISIVGNTTTSVIQQFNNDLSNSTGISNSGDVVSSNIEGSYPLAVGDFIPLATSPSRLTSMAINPETGIMYAQQNGGTSFYSYDPGTDQWNVLSNSPVSSGNNGGATYANGKIYTVYTGSSTMGVYDISSNSWTTMPGTISTGNIASDGDYLYLVSNTTFQRYDLEADSWTSLSSPGIVFEPWGGLEYYNGYLYGHTGNGSTVFQRYEISTDTWEALSNLPGGAVLGAAIDKNSGVYYAYGSYGGTNLYAYAISEDSWSIATIPAFSISDGGLVYSGITGQSGIYFVQGENGTGFMRLELEPLLNWISIDQSEGIINPSGSADLTVTLDATGLYGGTYESNIIVSSNDPSNPEVIVPVSLNVTGAPDIDVEALSLDFGPSWIGVTVTDSIRVSNTGTDELIITDLVNSLSEFQVSIDQTVVQPGESTYLIIDFEPNAELTYDDVIELSTNDADESLISITLTGVGAESPIISVNPTALAVDLAVGETVSRNITISNTGGIDLHYTSSIVNSSTTTTEIENESPVFTGIAHEKGEVVVTSSNDMFTGKRIFDQVKTNQKGDISANNIDLATLLSELNDNYASVSTLIPSRYDFIGGETGTNIGDGGNDMYDGGNYLSNNMESNVPYTNGTIQSSVGFDQYFTAKYSGLFVMVADYSNLDYFEITGNLGADGGGSIDGITIDMMHGGVNYVGFVKRVYGTSDPSVNHLIIVEDNGTVDHNFSTNTNDDFHQLTNLDSPGRIYYLLYASASGGYINDAQTANIMESFVNLLGSSPFQITDNDSGTISGGEQQILQVQFDASELDAGSYSGDLIIQSNDPINPSITVPLSLNVNGPEMTIYLSEITADLLTGESTTVDLVIGNEGATELVGDIAKTARTNSRSSKVNSKAIGFYADETRVGEVMALNKGTNASNIDTHDLGDVVSIDTNYPTSTVGMISYNNELYTVIHNGSNDGTLIKYNPESGTSQVLFDLHPSAYGLAYDGNNFWVGDANGNVYGYDSNGHEVGSFSLPFVGFSSLTWNGSNFVANPIWTSNPTFFYLDQSGVVINTFSSNMGDVSQLNYSYGSTENSNTFWSVSETGVLRKITMSSDNQVQILEEFNGAGSYFTYSIAHNGENILLGYWTDGLYEYDDNYDNIFWLTLDQSDFSISPNNSQLIQVTLNATGLIGGTYAANLIVGSNDAVNSGYTIPVTLNVTGAPDIILEATELDFGQIELGTLQTDSIRVTNQGTDVLDIQSAVNSLPEFSISITEALIQPGQSSYLVVSFEPSDVVDLNDVIELVTNDPIDNYIEINLSGTGIRPPGANLTSSTSSVNFGDVLLTQHQTLSIVLRNEGNEDLYLTDMAFDDTHFTVDTNFSDPVSPGELLEVELSFYPQETINYSGVLSISSNDPVNPQFIIDAVGAGVCEDPIISDAIEKQFVDSGEAISLELTTYFTNPIGGSLSYSVSEFNTQFIEATLNRDELILQALSPGVSSITVNVANTCAEITYSFEVEVSEVTGVDELARDIRIYPNPTDNKITIDLGSHASKAQKLSITNALGAQLYTMELLETEQQGIITLDISYLNNGVYYYLIFLNDDVMQGAFIKK